MTLDEAIKHAEDVAAKCFAERSARNHSGKCGFEHLELAAWLRELKAYKEQDHCENTDPKNRIARERYEDLVGYFGGDETILESREEFQKWLGRIKWHIKKCDELAREKEPEPCEDAISRKKVMDIIYRECSGENLNIDFAKIILLQRKIKALPSVTPKQKTGRWFYDKSIENWRCSECKETPKTMGYCGSANFMAEHFKFCNHCGAKMESEE
jgi:hypothetical protein